MAGIIVPNKVSGTIAAPVAPLLKNVKLSAAPVRPATPGSAAANALLTPAQLQTQATQQALADLKPQEQNIQQQETAAQAQAANDTQAIGGVNTAAAKILATIAPSIRQSYIQAAQETRQLGGADAAGVSQALQAAQSDSAALGASQGVKVNPTVDPNAVGSTLNDLGVVIPGSSLAAQGAATAGLGAGLVGAQAESARTEGDARIAQEHTDIAGLQTKLQTIAATYPQLRDKALSALQTLNLKYGAANETQARDQAAAVHAHNEDVHAAGQLAETTAKDQSTAQLAAAKYAQLVGHEHNQDTTAAGRLALTTAYDNAQIKFKNAANQLAVQKSNRAGRALDKNMSIIAGHAVDVDGNAITRNGKVIPVTAQDFSTSAGASPLKSYQAAVGGAKTLRGDPVKNTSGSGAAYFAAPGARGKGVVKDLVTGQYTTNDPNKAAYSTQMNFAQAQAYTADRYGITPRNARRALIKAGWKPDGVRPSSLFNPSQSLPKPLGG